MDPLSLVSRLAASVHPPRFHTIRYGGILAAAAKWRPLVVPSPPPEATVALSAEAAGHSLPIPENKNPRPPTHRCPYVPWHLLMQKLGIDIETCPRCGAKMKVIAFVQDPAGIARYLRHLGLTIHDARPRATVLAEPRPAPPLRGGSRRNPGAVRHRCRRPSRQNRSPFTGGQGLVCAATERRCPGGWVLVGFQHLAPSWGPSRHQTATPPNASTGPLSYLRSTATLRRPTGREISPLGYPFCEAPRGFATLAAGLRSHSALDR
jgi:hypothetical protein